MRPENAAAQRNSVISSQNQPIQQEELHGRVDYSAETIESIRSIFEEEDQQQANNNPNQEQQNIGESVFYPANPENYRNNRISVDDTPSPAIRGRTIKRIIDGVSAEIKDFGSKIKETFGKCLGR